MFTRRTFILSGASLAAIAGTGIPAGYLPDAADAHFVLSTGELGLVQSIGEAMFPPGNALGVSAFDMAFSSRVDALLDDMDPMAIPAFRYLIRTLNIGTLASRGALFVDLPLDVRKEILQNWSWDGLVPRRMAYDLLRTVLGLAFFGDPQVKAAIDYEPTCERYRKGS